MNKAYDTEYAAGNRGKLERIFATVADITPPLSEPAGMRRVVCAIDNRARVREPLLQKLLTMRRSQEIIARGNENLWAKRMDDEALDEVAAAGNPLTMKKIKKEP